MANLEDIENNIKNSINNSNFDLNKVNKIDVLIKKTEKMLDNKLLKFEKSLEFTDTNPEFGHESGREPKFEKVPHDWWESKHWGKTWENINRNYKLIEFKKSKDGKFKFFYSKIIQTIMLGVDDFEGERWYFSVVQEVKEVDTTPLTGASIQIKVSTVKVLNDLVSKIIAETEGLPDRL